jgi:hypothetical protein
MKKFEFLLLIVPLFFIFGCSGSSEIGSEKTIDKSGSSPEWVLKPTTDEDDYILVTGEITQAKDRSFGMSQAYADGLRKLMNMMQNRVKTQSSLAMSGNNMNEDDIGKFSEFAVGWVSDTKNISGVKNPDLYWEKIEKKTAEGVTYYYNCYSQLSISRSDYNKALEGAFNEIKKQAVAENNAKAEQAAKSLINELNK